MKQNNHFPQLFFSLWASVVLMLAVTFSMLGVQPVFARGNQQGTATTWYVISSGDDANDCQTPATPCASVSGALGKAASGDTIKVAAGTFMGDSATAAAVNAQGVTLSGGWDASFSTQTITLVQAITRASASPTSALSVDFTITFSGPVTGVDTADFALTTTGLNDASITSVTGSEATYRVTVATGFGADSIRLDVLDDDSILDAFGNSIGGTGANNGNFTTGEIYSIQNPVVASIALASPNPTSAASVKFTVTFSEAVTGVDAADFAVTANGPTGTLVTSLSGSGTTYSVTVNTGSGDGSLRLDVMDDDSILGVTGRHLGGTGAGNGDFRTGASYTISSAKYVAPNGSDANDCLTPGTPCASINAALGKAAPEDMIKVAVGTYTASSGTEVVLIKKDITLSGGWDVAFSAQSGKSIIDGQKARRGITVNSTVIVSIDHFKIQNGYNSTQGGGLQNSGGLTLNDSDISGNASGQIGGGVYNNGQMTINNTTISQNSAGGYSSDGGSGVYVDGTLTLNNSTINRNTNGSGEGIYIKNGALNLNNSTISANRSYGFKNTGGSITLQNTIVAGNGNSTVSDCSSKDGTVLSLGYNLIGNSYSCGFSPVTGDQVGTNAKPIDARLGMLQDNGGATQTQALYSDSPALNAGNPATPGSGGAACLATDQRGIARPVGSACDIGAYEGSVPFVKSITRANSNHTTAPSVDFVVTFSEAVTGVDTTDFTLLTFTDSPTMPEVTAVSGSDTTYTVSVKTGVGARYLRLDALDDDSILDTLGNPLGGPGAGNGNFTAGEEYLIPSTWYVSTNGSFFGVCLTGGTACDSIKLALDYASAGDTIKVAIGTYAASSGDEVVLIDKNITLSGGWDAAFSAQSGRSIIDGQKTRRGMTIGYAITALVDHFRIQNGFNNDQGGGIDNRGNLTLNNSIISDNVTHDMGGGIFNFGTLEINNTTISNNSAGSDGIGGGGGGGIETYSGSVTMNKSTVSNNILLGGSEGSGINASGTLTVNNSTISGNKNDYGVTGDGINTNPVSTAIFNNSTISGNGNYGIRNIGGHIRLQNTIIAGNGANSDCINEIGYGGTVRSQGYNLIGKSDGCGLTTNTGDKVGTIANPIDARLSTLQDHGGPTFTQTLLSGSPALNAGNPAVPGSGGYACLATDQRGVARPVGSACDIGAYEGFLTYVKSIKRAGTSPTAAFSVKFTIIFSEQVTGVDATDFDLTTAGQASAKITSVTGSGAVYIVTVATGLGADAIRLDVVDDDSILGPSSEPLGGTGAGNGNFRTGETYSIKNPLVASIRRVSPNPVTTASVNFTVTFTEPVTGVNTTAPFKDFALTTNGLKSAAITAVSGSGATYNVTVATTTTGQDNGYLRLDVVDDDSIRSAAGRPLAGAGTGDGNFKKGEIYSFMIVPATQTPDGESIKNTPTYSWSKIPGATQYQYQLWKGTTLVYTKLVGASVACGTTVCTNTPTTVLGLGAYQWRVRAIVNGVWKNFSAYKTFSVVGPLAGKWLGSWGTFYVTPARNSVKSFTINFSVDGCGNYSVTHSLLIPIVNNRFSFSGTFYANGSFDTLTSAHGTFGFSSYYIPGCGTISGSAPWTATWQNASQANLTTTGSEENSVTITPTSKQEKDLPSFRVDPIQP